jgi:hypothetical protein
LRNLCKSYKGNKKSEKNKKKEEKKERRSGPNGQTGPVSIKPTAHPLPTPNHYSLSLLSSTDGGAHLPA